MIGLLSKFGKKHVDLLFKWVPSAAVFGGTGAVLGVYLTEWRVISDYIPFYNGKFQDEVSQ